MKHEPIEALVFRRGFLHRLKKQPRKTRAIDPLARVWFAGWDYADDRMVDAIELDEEMMEDQENLLDMISKMLGNR